MSTEDRERELEDSYQVINHDTGGNHGCYGTIEEARGCVEFDRLRRWEIWRGDQLFAHSPLRGLETYQENLERVTGMLLRAFVSRDPGDTQPFLRVYTDDGGGNGNHIITVPWSQAKELGR